MNKMNILYIMRAHRLYSIEQTANPLIHLRQKKLDVPVLRQHYQHVPQTPREDKRDLAGMLVIISQRSTLSAFAKHSALLRVSPDMQHSKKYQHIAFTC